MQDNQHHHSPPFPVERIVFFSDAVMAIAITLLVIEIHPPELETTASGAQHYQFNHLVGQLIGFLVSFMVIGQFWVSHHRLFNFVRNFNLKMIWLNMFFLFSIALMPFSTSFYTERINMFVPFAFYCGNIFFTGIFNYLLWTYVTNHKDFISDDLDKEKIRKSKARALIVPVVFLCGIGLYLINPIFGIMCPVLIPIAMKVFKLKIS